MPRADPHDLLTLSLRLLCVGVFLRSLQLLMNWRELPDARLLGWNPEARGRKGLAWRMRALLCHPGGVVLLVLQMTAAGFGLFARVDSTGAVWLTGTLFGLQAWFNYRFAIVYHAADSMSLTGFGAIFAAALAPTEVRLQTVALSFLAIQVLLAYLMSGWAKIISAAWRDGSHLIEILRASAFRMERCGHWLSRRPRATKCAAQGVIFLELAFPFSVLLPLPLFSAILMAGALFHAGIAFVMGLPAFFWAFVAAYPAIYFMHQLLAAAF